ncbi:MAG: hypothetical protein WCG35_11255 [Betaproteobacteria bacterium]
MTDESKKHTASSVAIQNKQMWLDEARKLAENYIKKWRLNGYEPTAEDAALYVEGEFSTRGIYNTRGKAIERNAIRKEALIGVTGHKKGFKSKKLKVPANKRGKLPEEYGFLN